MKRFQRAQTIILILIPLVISTFFPFAAELSSFYSDSREVISARSSGDREKEIEALSRIMQYQPWRVDILIRSGELQFSLGNYPLAIEAYESASERSVLTPDDLYNLGKAYLANGDLENAKNVLRKTSEIPSQDTVLLLQIAQTQASINDSIGTVATLLRAFEIDPSNTGINFALGVQFAATQPDNAIIFLNNSMNDPAYKQAAISLKYIIQNTQTIKGSAQQFIYIGQQLCSLEEWGAAVSAFESAIQAEPKNAVAWALKGEALQHVQESGYEALSKALELDPHSDIVNGLMALYFRRQGKNEMALNYLYSAAENNPDESTWQIEIGNTLAQEGLLNDALIHFQVATMMEPENWVAWQELAAFCVMYNFEVDTTGIDAARKALLLYPGSPTLLDLMGSAYLVIGDYVNAERFLLEANEAAPDQAGILYHLGQLYLGKGEMEKALGYLRQAASVTTDERIRENANRLILMNGG